MSAATTGPFGKRELAPALARIVALLSTLTAVASLRAQPAPLDLQLAREPATVVTTTKREFSGLLDGFRDGRLFLRLATGGGEVGYSFAPGEIEKLAMPGAEMEAQAVELWDRGAVAEALPLLEALGRQRLRYLPVLTESHRAPVWLLVQASRRGGNPLATLGYVTQLRAHATTPEQRRWLRDAELEAHVQLGHTGEIERLATAWCAESDPGGASALGWEILARRALADGDFNRARWVALQPVVFSGHLPMEHLETCYAIAITAAHRLDDENHALALLQEMQTRHLAWPAQPEFADLGRLYAEKLASAAEGTSHAAAGAPGTEESAPAAEPQPEVNQPLANVRRLIGPASESTP